MFRFTFVAAIALTVLLVVACDGGSSSSEPTVVGNGELTSTPPADLQTAIATFEQASPPAPASPTAGAPRAPEVAAAEDLAIRLETSVDAITVISVVAADWSNSCLDAAQQGELCDLVVTPGFEVILAIGETTYTYHTNQDGTAARFAGVTIGGGEDDGGDEGGDEG